MKMIRKIKIVLFAGQHIEYQLLIHKYFMDSAWFYKNGIMFKGKGQLMQYYR